jgi:hypothetical protein
MQSQNLCFNSSKRLYEEKERTRSNWAKRLKAALEYMHDVEKQLQLSDLRPASTRSESIDKSHKDFDGILHQMLAFNENERETAEARGTSSGRSQPDVLTDFDDYPRGSSDTNSEDTEREKKNLYNTPFIKTGCGTNQNAGHATNAAFISLGLLHCQPREILKADPSCSDGRVTKVEDCFSMADLTRGFPDTASIVSLSTSKADRGKIPVDDSYGSWLERHSEVLGLSSSSKYKRKGNLNKEDICSQAERSLPPGGSKIFSSEVSPLSSSDVRRSLASRCGLPDVELHTQDGESIRVCHIKDEEVEKNGCREMEDFRSSSSRSIRIESTQKPTPQAYLFEALEQLKGSSKPSPSSQLNYISYLPVNCFPNPELSYVHPGGNLGHQRNWPDNEIGNYLEATSKFVDFQRTCPQQGPKCQSARMIPSPYAVKGNPSNSTLKGNGFSKISLRAETPQSVHSEGRSCAASTEHTVNFLR